MNVYVNVPKPTLTCVDQRGLRRLDKDSMVIPAKLDGVETFGGMDV